MLFRSTHAFSAFYRYLREDFRADAVLHFGTHGALEFMPGKQTGLSGECWPERLIGALPNVYLYAANNPSEGALAKRRSAATLVSYLTPSVTQAGLYKGLTELKQSIDRWRDPDLTPAERENLLELLQTQAQAMDLTGLQKDVPAQAIGEWVQQLTAQLLELEYALIPNGLHVMGRAPSAEERTSTLKAMAQAMGIEREGLIEAIVAQGAQWEALMPKDLDDAQRKALRQLVQSNELLQQEHEIVGLLRALDGRYIAPAAGGDLLRNPQVLPTGRNVHGLDPFRMPSNFAVMDGRKQAQKLLDRCQADGLPLPETIEIGRAHV